MMDPDHNCSTPLAGDAVRLSDLPAGAVARLHHVQLDVDARSQLRALGLTDASTLRVCQQGAPCVVQIRATRIGLSSRVAQRVFVVPDTVRFQDPTWQ